MTGAEAAPGHRFERESPIRFAHCDPAGIVFFPQYLVMFNGLVEDWVTEGLGVPYASLIGVRLIGLPTVGLQCDFSAISRMGERVTLGLSVARLGHSSIHLQLACRCGSEERVHAKQVLVTTDLRTHRSIPVPPDLREAMAGFLLP
ncbi:acyl-CoA thioesterase [soil metagenome]